MFKRFVQTYYAVLEFERGYKAGYEAGLKDGANVMPTLKQWYEETVEKNDRLLKGIREFKRVV